MLSVHIDLCQYAICQASLPAASSFTLSVKSRLAPALKSRPAAVIVVRETVRSQPRSIGSRTTTGVPVERSEA
jgi:hypothetical protein